MPIQRVGQFLEASDLGITQSIGIETTNLRNCIREIQTRNILGVFGCPVFGFKQDNLNFLPEIPKVKQVWFWNVELKDLDGVYALNDLEYFGIHEKRPAVDFSKFPKLTKVVWHPIRGDRGIHELQNLKGLDIWRYRSKDFTYNGLALPKNIRQLDLNWCTPKSLSGMPLLVDLEELQIHCCRNLQSIDGILDFAPNIRKLVVTRCANLKGYSNILKRQFDHIYINIKGKCVANKSAQLTP